MLAAIVWMIERDREQNFITLSVIFGLKFIFSLDKKNAQ